MCEAIEADFQQFYCLPLSPGRAYTWRRFGVLLGNLPQDSRFMRLSLKDAASEGKPDTSMWNNGDKLLALIADLLMVANWQRSGSKDKPHLILSDDEASKPKPVLPDSQIRDVLKQMREGTL